MEHQTRLYAFIAALIVIAGLIIYAFYRSAVKDKNKADDLKAKYDQALAAKDKTKALEYGRQYYSALRGGRLTIYDEQAITNDLSTIQ